MCGGRGASVKREGTVRVGEIKGCNLLFFEARSKRIRIVDCQTVATKWSRKTVEFFLEFSFRPVLLALSTREHLCRSRYQSPCLNAAEDEKWNERGRGGGGGDEREVRVECRG